MRFDAAFLTTKVFLGAFSTKTVRGETEESDKESDRERRREGPMV